MNPIGNSNTHENDGFFEAIAQEFLKGALSGLSGATAADEAGEAALKVGFEDASGIEYDGAAQKFAEFVRGPEDWSWSNVLGKAAYKGSLEVAKDFATGDVSFSNITNSQKNGGAFNTLISDFVKGAVTSVVSDAGDKLFSAGSEIPKGGNKGFLLYKGLSDVNYKFIGDGAASGLSNFMCKNNIFGTSGNAKPVVVGGYDSNDIGDWTGTIFTGIYGW